MPFPRRGARLGLGLHFIITLVIALVRGAAAQPVQLGLTNVVPAGKKPTITLTAQEAISVVTLELERQEDHHMFKAKAGPLKPGQKAELAIGDGKAGRAHWKGRLLVRSASGEAGNEVSFESVIGAAGGGLRLTYDRAHLDLEHGKLEFQVSRPATKAELAVIGEDGTELARAEQGLSGKRPGSWLSIAWKPSATPVLRLELKVMGESGESVLAKLVPWSVAIAHEEVIFPSGESTIPKSEERKLDASYQKITDAIDKVRKHEPELDVRVYVAGHTDTVGSSEDNRKLSQARARSIASWLRDRGLPMPLYYAGFGEDQPRVKTADNTDEARNRRADYVVGVEEPSAGRGRYAVLK